MIYPNAVLRSQPDVSLSIIALQTHTHSIILALQMTLLNNLVTKIDIDSG